MSLFDDVTSWATDKLNAAEQAASDAAASLWSADKAIVGTVLVDPFRRDVAGLSTIAAPVAADLRGTVSSAAASVSGAAADALAAVNPFSSSDGSLSLPWWLKLSVVGAVLVGTFVLMKEITHG